MKRVLWCAVLWLGLVSAVGAQAPTAGEAEAIQALERAETQAAAGQDGPALVTYEEARNKAGRQIWVMIRAWLGEGKIRQNQGDWTKAGAALGNAAALTKVEPGTPVFPDRPEILERLAACELARGNARNARMLWDDICTSAPHSLSRLNADRERFGLELRENKLAEASTQLDALLKRCPWDASSPFMLASLAQALAAANRPADALKRLAQLGSAYPQSEPHWTSRGLVVGCLRQLKQEDAALALLGKVLTETPERIVVTEAAGLRGEAQYSQGDLAGALAGLDEVAARYPGTFAAYKLGFQAALLAQRKGDLATALTRLAALDKAFPAPSWRTQTLRAMLDIYRQQRKPEDWERASDTAQALIDLTSTPERTGLAAEALLDKAQLEKEAGKLRAARLTLGELKKFTGPPFVPLGEELERTLK